MMMIKQTYDVIIYDNYIKYLQCASSQSSITILILLVLKKI